MIALCVNLLLIFWKCYGEGDAPVFAVNINTALVQFCDFFDYGKTYAVTFACVGFVCLVKFVENLFDVVLGYLTLVADCKGNQGAALGKCNADICAFRGEFDSIVNKVYPYLL